MRDFEDLKRWYEGAIHASIDYRAAAEKDRDYYDGKQWTSEELSELARRKQPAITDNLIKRKVDTEVGIEIQTRVDVKAFPRTPQDQDAAEAVTDALRYVADNKQFDKTKTDAAYNLVIEGMAAGIVEVEMTPRGVEVNPKHIPWDRFFKDPHSSRKDGKDARFMGQAIWMEEDEALDMFDADEGVITAGLEDTSGTDTYDDKPKNLYFDMKRKRVKIIEMYYQDKGTWFHCMFTGLGFVQDCKESLYLDEDGEPTNPIEMRCAFLDRDNNPYGSARQMISPQDEVNKRKSKSLHLLSVRQVIADVGAVDNENNARRELNKPDGWLWRNPGKSIEIQQTSDLAMGQFNLLQEAKQSIDSIGANAALAGKGAESSSGRAMQVRQQAGVVELQPVFDGLRDWELRIYRQIWCRIKQFWNEEKWIRVTDDERNVKFVGLNQPLRLADALKQQGQLVDVNDPYFQQVVGVQNNVAELDMDLILDTVPDAVTLQSETFEAFAQAAQASGTQIPLEIWLELMPNVPNRKQLLDKLNGGDASPEEQEVRQQQAQLQQQREQEQYELTKAKEVAEIKNKEADTQVKLAEIPLKRAKAEKEDSDAERQYLENGMVESGIGELVNQAIQPDTSYLT